MEISTKLIDKLATLSHLEFNEMEKESIRQDFERMVQFIEKLNELNLEGITPSMHVGEQMNVVREDRIEGSITQGEAFKNAPLHDDRFFLVPTVIKQPSTDHN
jgi:aspartyl-tRNA(Asn)/glutamyl-tRNA(Gln) amidotransferase subunit C